MFSKRDGRWRLAHHRRHLNLVITTVMVTGGGYECYDALPSHSSYLMDVIVNPKKDAGNPLAFVLGEKKYFVLCLSCPKKPTRVRRTRNVIQKCSKRRIRNQAKDSVKGNVHNVVIIDEDCDRRTTTPLPLSWGDCLDQECSRPPRIHCTRTGIGVFDFAGVHANHRPRRGEGSCRDF